MRRLFDFRASSTTGLLVRGEPARQFGTVAAIDMSDALQIASMAIPNGFEISKIEVQMANFFERGADGVAIEGRVDVDEAEPQDPNVPQNAGRER